MKRAIFWVVGIFLSGASCVFGMVRTNHNNSLLISSIECSRVMPIVVEKGSQGNELQETLLLGDIEPYRTITFGELVKECHNLDRDCVLVRVEKRVISGESVHRVSKDIHYYDAQAWNRAIFKDNLLIDMVAMRCVANEYHVTYVRCRCGESIFSYFFSLAELCLADEKKADALREEFWKSYTRSPRSHSPRISTLSVTGDCSPDFSSTGIDLTDIEPVL